MLTAAIIGCGDIAGGYDDRGGPPNVLTHAGAYAACAEDVLLVAACDPSEDTRNDFLRFRSGVSGFEDATTMLKTVRPDIVSVCSPTAFHEEHVMQALTYGAKAIICEKPLAESTTGAKEMVNRCRQNGVTLCVPYLRRWAPHFCALGQDIATGKLGALQAANVVYTKGMRHNASHFMDLLQSWCGDWSDPVAFGGEPWGNGDYVVDFAVTFGNTRTMFLHLQAECYEALEMQLFFEAGRVSVLRGGREFRTQRVTPHPVLRNANILASSPDVEKWTEDRNMLYMLRNVLDVLSGAGTLIAQPEEAVRVLELCDAITVTLEERFHG